MKKLPDLYTLSLQKYDWYPNKTKKARISEHMCEKMFHLNECRRGEDFEVFVTYLLNQYGFDARKTGSDDKGVDIIATAQNIKTCTPLKFFIQCKFWNKPVDIAPINEVFGGSHYHGGDGRMVLITSNSLTAEAKSYAKKMNVEYISHQEFQEIDFAMKHKSPVRTDRTGLLGLILANVCKDDEYLQRVVTSFNLGNAEVVSPADESEDFKQELINTYDQAAILLQEASEKQQEVFRMQQQVLALQKSALIRSLEYGRSELPDHVLKGAPMSEFFEQFRDRIDTLTPEQQQELLSLLSVRTPPPKAETPNKDNGEIIFCCPKCGSTEYKKHGTKNGRQRYLCKDCSRTFSESNKTIMYHSKITTEQWKELIRGMVDGLSMKKISENTGMSKSAVWYNTQKIYALIEKVYGKQDTFSDIAEADETFTRTSFKGKRDPEFFIYTLGRMPRHQRSYADRVDYLVNAGLYDKLKQEKPEYLEELLTCDLMKSYSRGISNRDQTNILVCTDRSSHLYVAPVSVGKLITEDAVKGLGGRFSKDAILVTDENAAYHGLAANEQIHLERILSTNHVKCPFSLARINNTHARLKEFLGADRDRPATKYLDLRLMFFWWLQKHPEHNTYEKVQELYSIITDNQYNMNMNYDEFIRRELTLNTKNLFPTKV